MTTSRVHNSVVATAVLLIAFPLAALPQIPARLDLGTESVLESVKPDLGPSYIPGSSYGASGVGRDVPGLQAFTRTNYGTDVGFDAKDSYASPDALSGVPVEMKGNSQNPFRHRIPIVAPRGANGMQPDLALVYDPNAGNGIMGMGWQLAGLSMITRVNYGRGINYDGQDTYSHSDLGILVKQSDGTYRSRQETFTKFVPGYGGCDDGASSPAPCRWEVTDRSGTVFYYGTDSASGTGQLKKQGTNSVRSWALVKVKDVFGNYYTVEYVTSSGRLYPDKITYTQGPGLSSFRTVRFLYESGRSDVESGYYQNDFQQTNQRLQWVEVRTRTELIRRYYLSYQYGTVTGRSHLISVQEYGKDGGTLPAQTFEWQQGDILFARQYPIISSTNTTGYPSLSGDFNGDGRTDIVTQYSDHDVIVALSGGNFFDTPEIWARASQIATGYLVGTGDFDGDGLTDIVIGTGSDANPLSVYLSSGTDFSKASWTGFVAGFDKFNYSAVVMGDFNGDGKTDILVRDTEIDGEIPVYLSTGNGFDRHVGAFAWPPGYLVGDFDGDGRTDLAFSELSVLGVDRFDGSRFNTEYWANDYPSPETIAHELMGDFNGDGKTDIAVVNKSQQVYIYLSTGTSFVRDTTPLTLPNFAASDSIVVGDLDGDKKSDIITWKTGSTDPYFNKSLGSTFNQSILRWAITTDFSNGVVQRQLGGNYAGQGRSGLATLNGEYLYALVQMAPTADLMTKVKNGLGGEVAIVYQPATEVQGAIDRNSYRSGIPNTSPRVLVTEVTVADGRGGNYRTNYKYRDGRVRPGTIPDFRDLGFRITSSSNWQSLRSTVVTHRIDTPYERRIQQIDTYVAKDREDSYLHSSSTYEYTECPKSPTCSSIAKGEGTELVLESKEVTTAYDLGVLAFRYTTTKSYDQYANMTSASLDAVNLPDTSLPNLTITKTYETDLSRWMLGKVKTITTTSGGTTLNSLENVWDGVKLSVKREWLNTTTAGTWPETKMTYDDNGNLTSVTLPPTDDGLVRATFFEYDNDPFRAAVTKVKNVLNHETSTSYYANGLVDTITSSNGAKTIFTYDEFGRKRTEEITPNGRKTEYFYLQSAPDPVDPAAYSQALYNRSITKMDDCVQTEKKVYFDGTGFNFYSTSQGLVGTGSGCSDVPVEPMVVTQYRKDAVGRVALVSRPYYPGETPLWIETQYEPAERVSQVTGPVNITPASGTVWTTSPVPETMTTHYSYSPGSGSVTDNNGKTTKVYFNARKQITRVDYATGRSAGYGYDELGNLIRVVPPSGSITVFTYDSWGRRRTLSDPESGNRSVTFTYDVLNRVTKQQVVGESSPSCLLAYDDSSVYGIGKLRRVTDANGVTHQFGYSQLGQLNQVSRDVEGGLSQYYKYDNAGRVTELTYPNGAKITYRYTAGGNLWKVLLDGADVATYSNFDARGKPGNVIYGNHIDTTYGYDLAEHLTSLSTKRDPQPDDPPGTQTAVLQQLTYNWYSGTNTGGINLGGITDNRTNTIAADNSNTSETQTYTYDDLYRLIQADGVWGTKKFEGFNWGGNPTRFDGLVSRTLTFDGGKITSGTGLSNVIHDSFGNMQHKELDGVSWDYTWNAENFLKEVRKNGVLTAQMTYDPWGQRTQKIYTAPNGEKVTTTYFGKTYEKRTYSNGSLARHTIYIFANGQLIAQVTKEGASATAYNSAHRWQGEMAAASVFNGYSAKGLSKKVYHYLNAATLHPQTLRWIVLFVFLLFASGVLAAFLVSKFGDAFAVSTFSPALRLASLSVLMLFTLSACGGGGPGGEALYRAQSYLLSGDTTLGPALGTYFYHRNHVNSSSVVTDAAGKEVTRLVYLPFGELAKDNSSGTDTVTSKFTGQEYDEEMGLYYYNARYYDPAIGRFISADTIIPNVLDGRAHNRYTYVLGNPIMYIDPSGRYADEGGSPPSHWGNPNGNSSSGTTTSGGSSSYTQPPSSSPPPRSSYHSSPEIQADWGDPEQHEDPSTLNLYSPPPSPDEPASPGAMPQPDNEADNRYETGNRRGPIDPDNQSTNPSTLTYVTPPFAERVNIPQVGGVVIVLWGVVDFNNGQRFALFDVYRTFPGQDRTGGK